MIKKGALMTIEETLKQNPAVVALLDYKQAGEDGIEVIASREAIHVVVDQLAQARALALEEAAAFVESGGGHWVCPPQVARDIRALIDTPPAPDTRDAVVEAASLSMLSPTEAE